MSDIVPRLSAATLAVSNVLLKVQLDHLDAAARGSPEEEIARTAGKPSWLPLDFWKEECGLRGPATELIMELIDLRRYKK